SSLPASSAPEPVPAPVPEPLTEGAARSESTSVAQAPNMAAARADDADALAKAAPAALLDAALPAAPVAEAASVVAPDAPALPAAPAAPAAPRYKDGTFIGWGTSRHGDIAAQVVIAGGRITSASIAECLTRWPCTWIDALPAQVVARQSPETDYVSGATQSTNAFYYAVVQALGKASLP